MIFQKLESTLKTFSLTVVCVMILASTGYAHTKKYVFNREYKTLPQGMFEIESWTKFKMPDGNRSNVNQWTFEQELEYGVTDHLTVAHYEAWQRVNKKGSDDSTTYKGFKFEAKYRFGEKGKYWLDPLLYLEWVTDVRRKKNPNKIEAKVVLSKDVGDWNFTYNQIMESRLGSGGRTEHKFTFGTSYALSEDLRIGLEAKGDYWRPSSHRNKLALGPTVAWEGKYFWVATGVAFGVNHAADDYEARVVVGIPFGG